jgi:nucleotide-binding universal stress UspA family protein
MTARGPYDTIAEPAPAVPVPLPAIVCGVNGTRSSAAAVERAIELAGHDGAIEFVAFTDVRGTGPTLMAGTGIARTEHALESARRAAADRGVTARTECRHHREPRRALLEYAADRHVLVVGAHPGSRAGGIMLGSTATLALHESAVPVLIARSAPAGCALGEHVVVATTGSGREHDAAELGAALAARAGGSVTLLHVEGPANGGVRHELALDAAAVMRITGRDPVIATVRGHDAHAIMDAASELGATLLVLGSRGLSGVRALASVGERVGAGAPCSVLVVRHSPV